MNEKKFKEQFVEYLTGNLKAEDAQCLEKALKESEALEKEYKELEQIYSMTKDIASEVYKAPYALQEQVMNKVINSEPSSWRCFMNGLFCYARVWKAGLAVAAVACLVVLVSGSVRELKGLGAKSFFDSQSSTSVPNELSFVRVNPDAPQPVKETIEAQGSGSQNAISGASEKRPEVDALRYEKEEGKEGNTDLIRASENDGENEDQGEYYVISSDWKKVEGNKPAEPLSGKEAGQVSLSADVKEAMEQSSNAGADSRHLSNSSPDEEAVSKSKTDFSVLYNRFNSDVPFREKEKSQAAQYYHVLPIPIPPYSPERYAQYEENQITQAAVRPLSTFSLDVDTGSYTNVRRIINSGQMPPPSAVRIEEFINYFDYAYPELSKQGPFALSYEIAPSPLDSQRYLLKLGLTARADRTSDDMAYNLVFLIDVSGSMADYNKLPLLKESLKTFVYKMRPMDKIAIVTYAEDTGVKLNPTSGNNKQEIIAAIDSLSAGGSTYGSGGIQKAYEVAQANRQNGSVNRVILATDGDFNVGITSFSDLVNLIEEKRKSGITLTTLGFGTGNYNEQNLEQLANKGNGNYFYIDSLEEARTVLGSKLVSNMEVVAKDAKVQIEFNPEHIKTYRLVGYDNRRLEDKDFNNDAIDAGEVGNGHKVTVLYEIELVNPPVVKDEGVDPLRYGKEKLAEAIVPDIRQLSPEFAFLKIRYKEPEGEVSKLLQFPLLVTNIKHDSSQTSLDFRFASAVSYFAHILRQSQYARVHNLEDIKTLASKSIAQDSDGKRGEFLLLISRVQELRGRK